MGTKPWFFTHVGRDMGKKCHFRGHNEFGRFPSAPASGDWAHDKKARCKQTEIGIIPQDWHAERIGEHITLISGHHVLAQFCNSSGVGTPYLTGPADFPQGKIYKMKFTTKPTTLCSEGDILITVKGSGTGTMVVSDSVYCISRQLMVIVLGDATLRFFFIHCFRTPIKSKPLPRDRSLAFRALIFLSN